MPPLTPPLPPASHAPGHSGQEMARSLTTLSSTIAQELGNRQRQQRPGGNRTQDGRESWSLGDLLARASRDDEPVTGTPRTITSAPSPAPNTAFNLDLEGIARALDPATAAAIWSRLRGGQRGVMVRSIYSEEGRALFDEIAQRCRADTDLARAITRYLADFDRAVTESDLRDPSGALTQSHLISDAGRVYLFLGHACGQLA
jgi:hypothetical protein